MKQSSSASNSPRAAIIAVGSEMLGPVRLDTNSLKITAALEGSGIPVTRKAVVGDDRADLVAEIRFATEHNDLVIMTGGLGPTEDDLTREALTEAFDLKTETDSRIIERIETRFAARGWKMPEVNRRQATVFVGHETLYNERGTAPGFHIEPGGGKHVWVFPGVPHELEWMIETYLGPWLVQLSGGRSRFRRIVKIAGLTESGVEERLAPYYQRHPEPLTILASSGHIEIHLQCDGDEVGARTVIAERERELIELFEHRIFGYDDDVLESVVGALLRAQGATLAVAESCTGGLLGSRITDVPGSSAYFLGGAICYTAEAKRSMAGVDADLIAEHGEVSEEVATALAKGIRERFGATWGAAITGIAGPTGGTPSKPVGTVHIAVAGPGVVKHRKLLWQGPRPIIKWYSTQQTLDLLRRNLLSGRSG